MVLHEAAGERWDLSRRVGSGGVIGKLGRVHPKTWIAQEPPHLQTPVGEPQETEWLRWFCERCGEVLHDATLHIYDLGTQLKPIIENFYASQSLRTCKKCGAVTQPPPVR